MQHGVFLSLSLSFYFLPESEAATPSASHLRQGLPVRSYASPPSLNLRFEAEELQDSFVTGEDSHLCAGILLKNISVLRRIFPSEKNASFLIR